MASLLRAARSQALRQRGTGLGAASLSLGGRRSLLAATASAAVRAKSTSAPHPSESFLSGNVTPYIEEMYAAYLNDPQSVHVSWRTYFANVDKGARPGQAFQMAPALIAATAINPASD
ncbi:hypothetical protein IW150_004446, partial [Coemansia sp. RSA 2607]